MGDTEWIIETEGLTKHYGSVLAVNQLSLQVPKGGVFGLLGPNGSGKTTTMGMLLGLVAPTGGSFQLFGGTPGSHVEALHRIGAIIESPAFYPYLSGRANLAYFQGISGRGKSTDVERLLEHLELKEAAGRKFGTYSLGMKQRLGIAYALLGDPELVFLDEPTNGLDPAGIAEVRDFVRALGTNGRTVVLSSHQLNEVEQVCDSVAILAKGNLLAQGKVSALLAGRSSIQLRTTDDAQALAILSAIEGVSDVRQEEGFIIVAAAAERAWELSRALSEQGIYIHELTPAQVSLEEYFLEVTSSPTAAPARKAA